MLYQSREKESNRITQLQKNNRFISSTNENIGIVYEAGKDVYSSISIWFLHLFRKYFCHVGSAVTIGIHISKWRIGGGEEPKKDRINLKPNTVLPIKEDSLGELF